jgi:hypothetical protein
MNPNYSERLLNLMYANIAILWIIGLAVAFLIFCCGILVLVQARKKLREQNEPNSLKKKE